MEKIEKNLIERKGKHVLKASTILEVTLNDYHHSQNFKGYGIKDKHKRQKSGEKYLEHKSRLPKLKGLVCSYIKEKELDIFFNRLLSSYTIYDKDASIESILSSIKDLVSKKLMLLIDILFNRDKTNWFISLKIDESDSQSINHFNILITIIDTMQTNLNNIPETLVESFAKALLSTKELNIQINKLVLKHFG
jgi:hypothetical protein